MNKYVPSDKVGKDDQNVDINWIKNGAVTEVKDQFRCNSGYAFSTTGNVEAVYQIKIKQLVEFSPQYIVDCSRSAGNLGCNGGMMDFSFQYIQKNGIPTLRNYPYTGYSGFCQNTETSKFIQNFNTVQSGNCTAVLDRLAIQPISIGVDSNNWQFYDSGVFSNCKSDINQGVLLVGVTDKYWIVKNSWGQDWGEQGYILLAKGNTCGLCNLGSYGIYESGNQ